MAKLKSLLICIAALGLAIQMAHAALPIGLFGANDALPSLAPMLDQAKPAVVNIATQSHVRVRNNPLMDDPFFRRFFNVPEQQPQHRT